MRGARSLYLPYISEQEQPESQGRGRSDFLIQRRDHKLVTRYYFYTWIKKINFEETIYQLCFEFDLAERTITDRLTLCSDNINAIMNSKPPVFELKREFPYFNWS